MRVNRGITERKMSSLEIKWRKLKKKGRSSGLTGREEEDRSHEQKQSLFTSDFFTFYVLGSGVLST